MNKNKLSMLVILMSSTLFAGCTTTPAVVETNDTVNTNAVNNETNTEGVTNVDDNTNIDQVSEVDTSDWLTYANEEYGFSFKYPKEWGDIEVKNYDTDEYRTGHKTFLSFTNDSIQTVTFSVESLDYAFTGPSDGGDIQFDAIDFDLSNSELAEKLSRIPGSTLQVTKMTLLNKKALRINEHYLSLNDEYANTYFLIPNYRKYNLRIVGDTTIEATIESLVATLQQL